MIFSQNIPGGSGMNLLIIPNENIELYRGPLPDRNCLNQSGERGCYMALFKLPAGFRLNYSDNAIAYTAGNQEVSPFFIRQLLHREQSSDGQYVSLIIPYGGAEIKIEDDSGTELMTHILPPGEPGQKSFFNIEVSDGLMPLARQRLADGEQVLGSESRVSRRDIETDADIDIEVPEPEVMRSMGILVVETDVLARIFVDGRPLEQGDELQLETGTYQVRIDHPLGNKTRRVNIQENHQTNLFEVMRPSRSDAFFLGLFIPGAGHIYTKRERGYLYLIGTLAGLGFSVYNYLEFDNLDQEVNVAMQEYNRATNIEDANLSRRRVEQLVKDRNERHDYFIYSIAGAGVFYGISFLDLLFSRPEFGYRSSGSNRSALSVSPITASDQNIYPALRFSYSW